MFSNKLPSKQIPGTTELVSAMVTEWAKSSHHQESPRGAFVLDGTPLADADLGDTRTMLPLLMWHADNLYRYAINQNGFGLSFTPDADALLAQSVSLDKVYRNSSEVLCFTLEALEDARANLPKCRSVKGAAELRSLVNRFTDSFGAAPIAGVEFQGAVPVKPQA